MADQLEMRPIVDGIILSLTRIRKLAAGVLLHDEPQPMVVLRADMEDALAIATEVADLIKSWAPRVEPLKQMGWGGLVSDILYGIAVDGAERVRGVLSNRLERAPSREIEPIHISVLITYDTRVTGSRAVLYVLSLELAWNNSPLSAITKNFNRDVNAFTAHAVDIVISMLPGIGPIYDIATGILGYRLPDAQELTNTERVLRIVFVGVGAVLSLAVKGGRITARTLKIMEVGKSTNALRTTLGKLDSFRALAVSVSKLSAKNAQRILEIVDIVRKGGSLSSEQTQLFWSFFHALNQVATAAHWAKIARNPANVGSKAGKKTILLHVLHAPGEKEAIEVLGKNLPDAEIVSLPGLTPEDFVKVTQGVPKINPVTGKPVLTLTQNIKTPDLVLEGSLADIYVPKGNNLKTMFNEIAGKGSQGSTIVVNSDFTKIPPEELVKSLPKLWGNPAGLSIRRVVVLNSKGFYKMVVRPLNFRLTDIEWVPGQTLANLRETWDEIEKEDAKEEAAAAKP